MDDGDTFLAIGELARRTGFTVKAIRFYSDRGIVPPAGRSPAGYRLYSPDAISRLGLVRTLRDLGLDLATIRKVMDRERSLPEVAAAHADALAVQIRVLGMRRAVLMTVAERGSTPEETALMHTLAQLSEDGRRRLIGDFLGAVFEDLGHCPGLAGAMRSMTPELPGDPGPEQIRAWVELAELSQDPQFRAAVRRSVEDLAAQYAQTGARPPQRDLGATVRDLVGPALDDGVGPESPEADPVVAALTAHGANALNRADDVELRRHLLARLETLHNGRRDRYFELLAVINGWPAPERLGPVLAWSVQALRVRLPDSG
ncbi:UNVERIFIED_CONTAM: DNA-binding transcriptional MerR regulator [Streptomyces graminofaciens]